MSIFNDLKASQVTSYAVEDVKAIRIQLQVSQVEFAAALGTSVDTIKSWEKSAATRLGLQLKFWAS
jgi:putative transcriptional regulator